MKKIALLMRRKSLFVLYAVMVILLTGCGVKDPSFYDLKSPCVSINVGGSVDPCIRNSPSLNQLYESMTL